MGQLRVIDHDAKTLSSALDVPQKQFEKIYKSTERIYKNEHKVSVMIEKCVRTYQDSELALALMLLGTIREKHRSKD